MSALSLHGVAFARAGQTVLSGIDLAFAPACLHAVIGPNGAGKSTLLALAAGLLRPAAGAVRLDGQDLSAIPPRTLARRRAYLPQRAGVDWPLSVERVVALGLTPFLPAFGPLPPALDHALQATIDSFDLNQLRHRPANALSGGELARVMLARACVGDPDILLVDEPTAGLDPRHALDAAARLQARAAAGRTVIMAMHDLDLALRTAHTIIALREGTILATCPVAALDAALLQRIFDLPATLRHEADGTAVRWHAPPA